MGVVEVIRELAPDALVLTEYVDADGREDFKRSLRASGLANISVSAPRPAHNQVLVASKAPHAAGEISIPESESHGFTNLLSVILRDSGLQLVGARAPAFKRAAETRAYWDLLTEQLQGRADEQLIVIGDLNADPGNPHSCGGAYLRELRQVGWQVPEPEGEWSFLSSTGTRRARIDRLVAGKGVKVRSARYESKVGALITAGPKSQLPLSDHAVLVCEI